MDSTQRYELIRPILQGEKTVKQVHQDSGVSIRTLYRYLSRFRASGGKIESLRDKSHAPQSHPNWFTDQEKALVINYKLCHPHKSASRIAKALTAAGVLTISDRSVSTLLKDHHLATPFLSINLRS